MSDEVTITDADRAAASEIFDDVTEGFGPLSEEFAARIIARHRSEREKRLMEALRPLANLYHPSIERRVGAPDVPLFQLMDMGITVADVLAARSILAELEGDSHE